MKTKKFISFFCLLLAMGTASAVFTACGNDDPTTTFSVEPATIEATADAASYLIAVTSRNTWTPTVSTDSEWCTLSNAIGTGGLTVNVAANTTDTIRSATVTISSGKLSKQVVVEQAAQSPVLPMTITAKVSTGHTIVDAVVALASVGYDNYIAKYVIAEGTYENGGFTLDLPRTVRDIYLTPFIDDAPDGITVNDPKAKGIQIEQITAYNGRNEIGEFRYGYESDNTQIITIFTYADRDVKITGRYTEKGYDYTVMVTFNVYLKKGWNTMYATYSVRNNTPYLEVSSTEPSGLEWLFSDGSVSWGSDANPTRVAKVAKPLFGGVSALF